MKAQTSALLFSTIAMCVSFIVWTVIAPIAPLLKETYGLNEIQVSMLVVTPVILGSLLRIPMGILTDRYGGRKIYTITMLSLITPLLIASFTDTFSLLWISTFFIGIAGSTFAIAVSYVSKWYPPERQGFLLGIVGLGNIGTAISNFTLPTIVSKIGLSATFWGLAFLIGFMALIFWINTKELPARKNKQSFSSSLAVMKFKSTWLLSLFYFLTFGGFIAFGLYLPVLLKEIFSISMVDAGIKTAVFVLIATFVRPIGGYLADRYGAKGVLFILFLLITIQSGFMTIWLTNFSIFTMACLSLAVFFGAGNGAVFKLVPEIAPTNTGAVSGVIGAVGGIGGFFLPIVLGLTKGVTGYYNFGFLILACLSLGCFILTAREIHTQNSANNKQKTKISVVHNGVQN